jgi:methionyl-tRNA synthetase
MNRYVEQQAPWQMAKVPERSGELETVLRSLAEGLRAATVLLWPYLPESCDRLLEALGAPERSYAAAGFGAGSISQVRSLESLFPKDLPAA